MMQPEVRGPAGGPGDVSVCSAGTEMRVCEGFMSLDSGSVLMILMSPL